MQQNPKTKTNKMLWNSHRNFSCIKIHCAFYVIYFCYILQSIHSLVLSKENTAAMNFNLGEYLILKGSSFTVSLLRDFQVMSGIQNNPFPHVSPMAAPITGRQLYHCYETMPGQFKPSGNLHTVLQFTGQSELEAFWSSCGWINKMYHHCRRAQEGKRRRNSVMGK